MSEEYPKIMFGRLSEKGNLRENFEQVLDCFILKKTGKYSRKWCIQLGKSHYISNTEEGKPRSFRSESLIQLKEMIHVLLKLYGCWTILDYVNSPVADKGKIKSEEFYGLINSHFSSLSPEFKRSFSDGFMLALETEKIKII